MPFLSVVIVDYGRKQFLRSAVDSVINQTLDSSLFEIFVLKNYNSEIDIWLDELGVNHIFSDEKSYGKKISTVLKRINGEVIVLLDDDDLFTVDKLSCIYNIFTKYKNLGFFHNYYSKINQNGMPFIDRGWYLERYRSFDLISGSQEFKKLARVMYLGGDFNHSSISFRKKLLEGNTRFIEELSGNFDTFIFFLTAMSGYDLMFTSKKLTHYRLHESASSTSVDVGIRHKYLTKQHENYSVIYRMVTSTHNEKLSDLIRNKMTDTEISQFFLEDHNRRNLISSFIRFIATSQVFSIYFVIRFLILYLYLWSPKICLFLFKGKI